MFNLNTFYRSVQFRLNLIAWLREFLSGINLGAGILILIHLTSSIIWRLSLPSFIGITIIVAIGLIWSSARIYIAHYRLLDAVRYLDSHYQLHERLTTAFQIDPRSTRSPELTTAFVAETQELFQQQPKLKWPLKDIPLLAFQTILVLLITSLITWWNPMLAWQHQQITATHRNNSKINSATTVTRLANPVKSSTLSTQEFSKLIKQVFPDNPQLVKLAETAFRQGDWATVEGLLQKGQLQLAAHEQLLETAAEQLKQSTDQTIKPDRQIARQFQSKSSNNTEEQGRMQQQINSLLSGKDPQKAQTKLDQNRKQLQKQKDALNQLKQTDPEMAPTKNRTNDRRPTPAGANQKKPSRQSSNQAPPPGQGSNPSNGNSGNSGSPNQTGNSRNTNLQIGDQMMILPQPRTAVRSRSIYLPEKTLNSPVTTRLPQYDSQSEQTATRQNVPRNWATLIQAYFNNLATIK